LCSAAPTVFCTLSLRDALPISLGWWAADWHASNCGAPGLRKSRAPACGRFRPRAVPGPLWYAALLEGSDARRYRLANAHVGQRRSEEHTSELSHQLISYAVFRF